MRRYNNILIKDSTLLGAKTLSSLFKLSDYYCDYVNTHEELLDILRINHEYDLLIYDPGIFYKNDFNFIKDIKHNNKFSPATTEMDIIILSGSISNGDKLKFINCGITKFIPKPIKFENLIDIIEDNLMHYTQYPTSNILDYSYAQY